jgi:hypothetical protein
MKRSHYLLIIILILAIFFRLWRLPEYFTFGHDEDLAAWIIKDIYIDHHLRLIGQETSIGGVFVGPLFYYLLGLFFVIFGGDPLGGMVFLILTSLATIFSIYWVFSKFFSERVGLLSAFIYAISMSLVFLDRWMVPTQTTFLFTIWFFYLIFSIYYGKLRLPLIGLIVGLIWYVHVAFIPLILLIPLSFYLSPHKSKLKAQVLNIPQLLLATLIFAVLISPFVLFELRHGFQQIHGLLSVTNERGQVSGIERLGKIYETASVSLMNVLFFYNNELIRIPIWLLIGTPIIFLGLFMLLWRWKVLERNLLIILGDWILLDVIAQVISKRGITEYYFNNLVILFLLFISLVVFYLKEKYGFPIIIATICCFFFVNLFWLFSTPPVQNGYLARSKIVDAVRADQLKNNYPCVAINYIGDSGVGGGYRYLFWQKNVKQISPGNDVPVYSIVFPYTISGNEVTQHFGGLGLITPRPKSVDPNVCISSNRQLLPLSGFDN